nr:immunoglobulin light chain junction region [Macaca mulatta]
DYYCCSYTGSGVLF